jgi:UDP-N-acetyl-2-amino-2-deoxyglucuronate dehydrogenase
MSGKIGIAVVGVGMAAKPHALALKDLEDVLEVRGVYSRSQDARSNFCQTYNFPESSDLDALAQDPRVDALLLITPPDARSEIVSLFASHGKHILSEKPLERTVENAEDIVKTCITAGVSLGVVFQHRFRSASENLLDMFHRGSFGAIHVIRAEVPWWRDQEYYDEPGRGSYDRDGGGVLISQAIHTLDLMLQMSGPVTSVQAMCARTPFHQMEAEDVVAGAFKFENGAIGSVFASTASFPGGAESLTFECEKASLNLKAGVLKVDWRDGQSQSFGEKAQTGGGADPMAFPYEWHKSLIADFVDAIKMGRQPRVTGIQALAVHRLIRAIEISSREGRQIALKEG